MSPTGTDRPCKGGLTYFVSRRVLVSPTATGKPCKGGLTYIVSRRVLVSPTSTMVDPAKED